MCMVSNRTDDGIPVREAGRREAREARETT